MYFASSSIFVDLRLQAVLFLLFAPNLAAKIRIFLTWKLEMEGRKPHIHHRLHTHSALFEDLILQ